MTEKRLAQFIATLPSPDNVGQSEYRALHEFITDLVGSDAEDLDVARASLDEVQLWAMELRRRLYEFRYEVQPPPDELNHRGEPLIHGAMYLHLFHGREQNERLHDWGFDGPRIGPLQWYHTTYKSHWRYQLVDSHEDVDLEIENGLVKYEGKYYGDWSAYVHREDNEVS